MSDEINNNTDKSLEDPETANPDMPDQPIDLLTEATEVLRANDRGNYTIPAENLYPHQWLWDSCFIAIGWRHIDVDRAKMEILSLLRGQWSNGMLPNMIFSPEPKYRRDRNVWRSWVNPFSPDDVATSGITQPPMLAEAVMRIGEKLNIAERRSWYKMVLPAIVAYHEWLYTERDPHKEGLTLQIHPWETGLDNTPPWMAELHDHMLPWWVRVLRDTHLDKVVNIFRRDTHYIPPGQRFSTIEVLALFDAQRRLRRKGYDIERILDHSLFAIEDLNFNSILIRANECLEHIAKTIRHELPGDLLQSIAKTRKALEELWDPYSQNYFSRDFITHRLLKEPSIATLMPLYAGTITAARAKELVQLLENEHIFGPSYPVPSTPLNSPVFDPERYWQGPSWVNTNWLIIDGLKRYGFKDHAAALTETTLEMVAKSGMSEYFDPNTAEPLGAPNFSWTAALVIDLLKS
ncbi:MAG: trehalase family glycosidase [Candidatus Saccharimonadales bacterium]